MGEFEEYKKVGEPSVREKAQNWGIAIGLQQVDGLTPSKYLYQVARENIEGKISMGEVYNTKKSPLRVRQLFSAMVAADILIATGDNKARKYKLNNGGAK
ncbi:MAG: antitoxin VbhA family protein [Rickettsiales bacterium]|jgi:hypothetical protein|nr:antitoxin VbhA family protein [Rickettsiales bacterium]